MPGEAAAILDTDAYHAALAGGRHAGWLENVKATMRPRQIRKAIVSLEKQIERHLGWIADPLSKPGMAQASPEEVARCVGQKWPEDIARQTEQKHILIALLEEIDSGKGSSGP